MIEKTNIVSVEREKSSAVLIITEILYLGLAYVSVVQMLIIYVWVFFSNHSGKKNPYSYALSCSKQFLKIYNLLWIKSRTLLVRLACIRFLIVCLQKYSQDVSCSYEWFMNYSGWHIHMLMSYIQAVMFIHTN